jgi:thiol-disulfide isomerase/thioredoxin
MRCKLLLLMIVLAMAGCRNTPPSETSPWIGKNLPEFAFPSIANADTIRSSDLRGKVTLVTFWATWCPSCLQEVPILKGVHKTHGPKGLQVVALSVDKEPQLVEPLARRLGMEYQLATGAERLHMELGLAYIPHTFLLDTAGIVRASFSGGVDREGLDRAIEQLGLR